MARRSVTDEEIGLIKAMLARDVKNRDIQFYFNRQDRPVNSGRITGIRTGSYGPNVPVASEAALNTFLANFTPANVGAVVEIPQPAPQTIADRVRQRFRQREDRHWYLDGGETAEQECKEIFDPRRLSPLIRAIAGLANNRGGFIFLGVRNADCRAVGLSDDSFHNTDIASIANKVKTYLTPTPIFSKDTITVGNLKVGFVHVEKHDHPPVIVCRDGDGLEDGTILFRYPGQTARIKFGDLHAMLRERDRSAHSKLLSGAARLSEIGTDKALIVDTREGTVTAGETTITIDRELADQLEFIREGEFDEREGAPTLRLMGDVRVVDSDGRINVRIEGRVLTPDLVVRAFLNKEKVRFPFEYIRVSALVQRHWLPLFYFIHLTGKPIEEAISVLDNTQAAYLPSKQKALERLRGALSAYSPLSGHALPVGQEIMRGEIEGIGDRHDPTLIARAIQSLPNDCENLAPLFDLLDGLHGVSLSNAPVRGAIYRAACRLDEIEEFRRRQSQ